MSRHRTAFAVAAVTVVGLLAPMAPASAAAKAANLIKDPGAETAKPVGTDGGVVPVGLWKSLKGTDFTAVKYGPVLSVPRSAPGPASRGKNYFAGGIDGALSGATQVDSLKGSASLIKAGKAVFTLSGYFGGYQDQRDYATLTVVWQNAKGVAVGKPTAIGDVTAGQRKDITGLLARSKKGTVPTTATQAMFEIKMVRFDGRYNDGYADNLSLTIVKS